MLLEDCLKEFIFDCKLRKLSERTIKSYRNNNLLMFSYLRKELDIIEVEDVNHKCIQSYIDYLMRKELKESYINGLIKVFRAFFKYAYEEEYINRNPMLRVKWQKEEIPVITTFTNDEVRKMIAYYSGKRFLDVRNKLIMVVLLDTGIRNNELCTIKLDDIKDTYIVIHGKGKKIRHVPITHIVNKYLIKYFRIRDEYIKDKFSYQSEYLFLSQKGKQLTIETVERVVKDCGDGAGIRKDIRCSPHTCRHYYAQAQLMNGCDIYTLSKLLGHQNINITKRYLLSMHNENFIEMGAKTSPLRNL